LLLRRLLHGGDLEPAHLGRPGSRQQTRGEPDRLAVIVRPGSERGSLRRFTRRRPVPALGLRRFGTIAVWAAASSSPSPSRASPRPAAAAPNGRARRPWSSAATGRASATTRPVTTQAPHGRDSRP